MTGKFDPAYLTTLDEIYHPRWVMEKRRGIELLRQAVRDAWPSGHPTKLVHVSGTNGKGSVCFALEQALRFAGPSGSWTGPHVFDYAERFHINGAEPDREEIVEIYRSRLVPYQNQLAARTGGPVLTFAQLGILLSLFLFERHGVRWAAMESGVGGRYTPLMALDVKASVVTDVGSDHPRTLGAKLWQRALEKAGVAREGTPFFTAAQGDALEFVVETARCERAEVCLLDSDDLRNTAGLLPAGTPQFVVRNHALAARIVRHFYPARTLEEVLGDICRELPGRFTLTHDKVVADVAHNADKTSALAARLRAEFPGKRFRYVVGLTSNRDALAVLQPLFDQASSFTVTSASFKGRDPSEVARELSEGFDRVCVEADPCEAFRQELDSLGGDEILVLTGSTYVIDQALNPDPFVRDTNASYGRREAEWTATPPDGRLRGGG